MLLFVDIHAMEGPVPAEQATEAHVAGASRAVRSERVGETPPARAGSPYCHRAARSAVWWS